MITSMTPKTNLSNQSVAYTTEKTNAPSAGGSMKVYVPSLMTKITKGKPTQQKVSTKGTSVFVNASGCCPKAKSIVSTQNYISATMEKNSTWDGIASVTKGDKGNVKKRTISSDTKISCSFANEKLASITFNTDKYLDSTVKSKTSVASNSYSGDVNNLKTNDIQLEESEDSASNANVRALKSEISDLKETVNDLLVILRSNQIIGGK